MALRESLEQEDNILFRDKSFLPLIMVLAEFNVFFYNNINQQVLGDSNYTLIEINIKKSR